MLQNGRADDFVIATREVHTVREFGELAFRHVGLDWTEYVEIDPRYYRLAEVDHLQGYPSKLLRELGWALQTTFHDLVQRMVEADAEWLSRRSARRVPRCATRTGPPRTETRSPDPLVIVGRCGRPSSRCAAAPLARSLRPCG
jgi:hypothetical protein